jgi:chitodextrinase
MKNLLLKKRVSIMVAFLLMLSHFAISQTPPGDLSGENLKSWLRTNYYDGKHQTLGYNTARRYLYNYIDNENNVITCVYSGYEVNSAYGGTTTYPAPINCEHTIPQSLFNEANPMVSDIHHLYPTYENWNSTRSNHPFDEINDSQTEKWMYLNQSITSIPSSDINSYSEYASSEFEPREDHKGNTARAIFYFYTMYPTQAGDMSQVGDINVFYQWHLDDPVDAAEIERNGEIETYQGDRNPYIDYPELVARAWGLAPVNNPPASPTLQVNTGATSLSLVWNNVSDENGYKLYKSSGSGYSLLNTLTANTISYTDNSVSENITYSYYILAYNDYGNSSNSNTVSGELNSGNTGTGISVSEAISLSTGTSVTVDGIITGSFNGVYALSMKDISGSETIVVKLGTSLRDEWSPDNNPDAVGKTIEVVGKRDTYSSQPSIEYVTSITEIGGTTEDTEAPTAPNSLGSSSITETSVNLSWTASTDNVGVSEYDIYRNGSYLASSSNTTYNVTGLTASTSYTFYVKAKDEAGNISAASNTINVTTSSNVVTYCSTQGNNSSYEWIANVEIGSYTNSSGAANYTDFTSENISLEAGSSVSVSLTPGFSGSTYNEYWKIWIDYNADGDFDDSGELVFDAGSMSKTTVSGNMSVSSTASGTTRMRVSMKYNGAQTACESFSYGEVEDYTVTFGAAVADTQAPTVPSSLSSSNITSSSAIISWNASSDNVAVTEYEVYRNGSQIGTSTNTSYSVSGLSSSTQYTFVVKAKDAAGNVSNASSNLYVTTSDVSTTTDLTLTITFDNYPEETSWTLKKSGGSNVASGGTYASQADGSTLVIPINDLADDCYDFTILDAYGDGICCSYGNGSYSLAVTGGSVLASGGSFTSSEVTSFCLPNTRSKSFASTSVNVNDNVSGLSTVNIYPNPANTFINVDVINGHRVGTIRIYNTVGTLVKTLEMNGSEKEIDISELPTGLYIISIEDEKEPLVKQFIKQ